MIARGSWALLLSLGALGAACSAPPAPPPQRPAPPPSASPPEVVRELPPPPGALVESPLPAPVWAELPGGLSFAAVERHSLPVVQIRIVVRAGRAADGDRPGVAALTAALLEEGGAGSLSGPELGARVEELGATLAVSTDFDQTTLSLAVLRDDLGPALQLLGSMITRPKMDPKAFEGLRRRKAASAADLAQEDGEWAASFVLWRDLFQQARWDAVDTEIEKITLADCRSFRQKHYVPSRTLVVLAGDTTAAEARPLVEEAFRGYKAAPAPTVAEPAPALRPRTITVVDRPGSLQSDIQAALPAPGGADPRHTALTVMNRVLGGKGTGRLFMDVREKLSLAYYVTSRITDLAGGQGIFSLEASTRTESTGLTVQAFLDHLQRLADQGPTADEVTTAARFLAEDVGVQTEKLGSLAAAVARARVLGLPDVGFAAQRRDLLQTAPGSVAAVAREILGAGPAVIVVAGDAAIVGPMLSHFGEVTVVDPKKGFTTIRTLPMNPAAALQAPTK